MPTTDKRWQVVERGLDLLTCIDSVILCPVSAEIVDDALSALHQLQEQYREIEMMLAEYEARE